MAAIAAGLCSVDGCGKATYCRGRCSAHYAKWKKTRPPIARARPAADADPTLTARTSLPELLAGLAAAVPPLPGARCRDHAQLFDRTVWQRDRQKDTREARTAALAVCHQCPALDRCRAWLDGLPADQRPIGVVAGQIVAEDTTSRVQRERAERNQRITKLHAAGMANHQIAAALGCSNSTVSTVLRAPTPERR